MNPWFDPPEETEEDVDRDVERILEEEHFDLDADEWWGYPPAGD